MKSGSLIAAGFFLHTFFPQYSELQIEKHNSYPVIFYSIKTQVRQRPLGPRVRGDMPSNSSLSTSATMAFCAKFPPNQQP